MSQRTQMILLSLGLAVVLLLTYFFLVKPEQEQLGKVRDQVVSEESRTQALGLELSRLQDLQERAPELQANLDQISEMVPRNDQVSNFIFQVQQASEQAGLDFIQVTPELPKPPPEGAQLAEVRLAIGAKGGYFTVQDFVRRLYDLDRALRVDNFSMGSEEDQETSDTLVNLQMTARIFFELPEGSSTTDTTTETSATPAPATSASTN